MENPPPAATSSSSSFPFPMIYRFPPFFTLQDNLTTRHHQLRRWRQLVVAFCRHHRIFRLSPAAAASDPASLAAPLFHNAALHRRLSPEAISEVMAFMRSDGSAERVASSSSGAGADGGGLVGGSGGGAAQGKRNRDAHWIYWKKPAEWATVVEAWVRDTAQEGVVFTLFELTEGEATEGTEFHGMEPEILRKALNVLVREGRATIFGSEDSLGVKFLSS